MADTSTTRRSFMQTIAGGAIGGTMLRVLPGTTEMRDIVANDRQVAPDDERFWDLVRDQFSLTRSPLYLNNGTMGPSPYAVADAVKAELDLVDRTGRYGGWDDVRPKLAEFIGARPDEISITHNVTEGINVVAWGLPLRSGDEVILTNHEHAGNAVPWLTRARRDGLVVKVLQLTRDNAGILDRLNSLITKRTRVIAVPHITCTTGQVLPAQEICALGRQKGIWVMLDAAHTPGMMPLDVRALGCDFLATCGHKWMMGPKGTGFLYVRKDLQDVLQPIWAGGGSASGWDVEKGTLTFTQDARRYDFASQSAALYTGLGAATGFLRGLGMDNVFRRTRGLADRLRNQLLLLGERVEILTPDQEGQRGAILGFRLKSVPFDRVYSILHEEHKVITRMVPENGVNGNRISTHIYNSTEEVDRVAAILRGIAGA